MSANFIVASSSSLVFDATDDVMTENGALTISVWIKPITVGVGNLGRVINRGVFATSGVEIIMTATETVQFFVNGSTNLFRVASNNSITLNTWQHILVTWNGGTAFTGVNIYVNGVETSYSAGQNATTPIDNSTTLLRIGNVSTGTRSFDGLVSEVGIWNSVLSLNEIKQLSSSRTRYVPLQVSPSSLKRYFPLDEFSNKDTVSGIGVIRDRSPLLITGSGSFVTGGALPTMLSESVVSY